MLDYKESQINIKPDKSIVIKAENVIIDQAKSIELGKGATEPVILGKYFMDMVFNTHTHIGNLGAPTSPPMVPMTPVSLSGKGSTPKTTVK